MPRTEADSTSYYYKHGYNLMNPTSRIITGDPTLRAYFELKQATADDPAARVRQILVTGGLYSNAKATALLGCDADDLNSAFTGNASIQTGNYLDFLKQDQPGTPLPDRAATHDVLLAEIYNRLYDKFLQTWEDIENVKSALHKQAQPDLGTGVHPAYLIRGDSQAMIGYLNTAVPNFRQAANRTAVSMDSRWTTNQQFSTSKGETLASLAGRAMIWLIRVNPQTTKGRSGGLYGSENEVLLPLDATLAIKGMITVSSSDDAANVDLSGIPDRDAVRAKMEAVYNHEGNSLKGKPVCFLVSEEE